MRGQLYTLIVIMVTIPIFMMLSYIMVSNQSVQTGITKKIISDQLHQTEHIAEKDLAKAINIITKRALIAAIDHVSDNGTAIDNATLRLKELMENGTLYGEENFIMENNTLKDWQDRMISFQTRFNFNIVYFNLTLSTEGFFVTSSVNFNISVSDKAGLAEIVKTNEKKTVSVELEGMKDTIFPLHTEGFVRRTIRKFPYPYTAIKMVTGTVSIGNCSGEVTFNESNPNNNKILVTHDGTGISGFRGVVAETGTPSVSCYITGAADAVSKINSTISYSGYTEIYLDQQTLSAWSLPIKSGIQNGYYFAFNGTKGPDIFQRLENNLTESASGMETFVNIPELQSQGITIKDEKTCLAYLYFSDISKEGAPVRGLQEWFRIDSESANRYNLTELLI